MMIVPLWLPVGAAGFLERAAAGWREAKMWTVMYRGGLLIGSFGIVAFIFWRILASRRERERLETLVASRTRQLRQSEELFRSIFEHAAEGIFLSSLDGHNLRANSAMARLCGYASPQEMKEKMTDVETLFYVQPGRRAEINAKLAREGVVLDFESEIRRRDGGTIWIAESVQAVVDPATGETVYQGCIVDITARREMQEAREQARAAAEAANRAKSAFLAHMTHELRTPLTGILGSARVALRDPATDEKNRERYALITGSGEHLLRLIDEVLDHSRIEAGRLELRPAPFDLDELLHTVIENFHSQAAEARLELRCEADPALLRWVTGDALRLRQVLDNLLGNALKFTDHGRVVLGVRRGGTSAEDSRPPLVRFEVKDTGIGIPPEHLEAIFRPFEQTESTGRSALSGVGLGLNISARLVELMGGMLRVESTIARGSRFFFDIPLPDADDGKTLHDTQANERAVASPAATTAPRPLTPPPDEVLDALIALSLAGDIVRLRESATEIFGMDPAYADFARELERLAAGFRMDAIGELLQAAKSARLPFGPSPAKGSNLF